MFFRKKKEVKAAPIVGEDGKLYVENGQDYDTNEYETDSDDDDNNDKEEEESYDSDESYSSDVSSGSSDDDDDDESLEANDDANVVTDQEDPVATSTGKDDALEVKTDNNNTSTNESDKNIDEQATSQVVEEQSVNETVTSSSESTNQDESANESSTQQEGSSSDNKTQMNGNSHTTSTELSSTDDARDASLDEKRCLLALAAEHDRVDILKSILEPPTPSSSSDTTNDNAQKEKDELIQFLLNNTTTTTNNNNDNILPEKVFIPPIHLAVASSSTNVVTCLLRMGANPSIRPSIPQGWTGPAWYNPTTTSGSSSSTDNSTTSSEKWSKFHGFSAWELAFGKIIPQSSSDNEDTMKKENGVSLSPSSQTNPTNEKSWFGWSSSQNGSTTTNNNNNNNNNEYPIPNNPFNLEPSKVEAIRHAFTAEMLRSISADESNRLRELLDSGFDHGYLYMRAEGDDSKATATAASASATVPSSKVLDVGGKGLFEWCSEMKAYKCNTMLQERYGLVGDDITANLTASTSAEDADGTTATTTDNNDMNGQAGATITTTDQNMTEIVLSDDVVISNNTIAELEQKLEENNSLSTALSTMLDNIAEEVSLTQGLILRSNGNGSNSALLSQVRVLKDARAEKEDELLEWEGRLSDLVTEWDMCVLWWRDRGWKEEDLPIFDDGSFVIVDQSSSSSSPKDIPFGEKAIKERIVELSAQLQLSTNNVQSLRTSISDLAEELKDNMTKVQKLGLTGAIQLSRTLKEEVREREDALQQVKSREAVYRAHVQMIRNRLETTKDGSSPAPLPMSKSQEEDVTFAHHSSDIMSNEQERLADANPLDDEVILTSESMEDEEERSPEGEPEDENQLPSQAVASGNSTAIIPRKEGGYMSYLSIDFWELLMRIIGLGRKAVKATVKSKQNDNSYVMIV